MSLTDCFWRKQYLEEDFGVSQLIIGQIGTTQDSLANPHRRFTTIHLKVAKSNINPTKSLH